MSVVATREPAQEPPEGWSWPPRGSLAGPRYHAQRTSPRTELELRRARTAGAASVEAGQTRCPFPIGDECAQAWGEARAAALAARHPGSKYEPSPHWPERAEP